MILSLINDSSQNSNREMNMATTTLANFTAAQWSSLLVNRPKMTWLTQLLRKDLATNAHRI